MPSTNTELYLLLRHFLWHHKENLVPIQECYNYLRRHGSGDIYCFLYDICDVDFSVDGIFRVFNKKKIQLHIYHGGLPTNLRKIYTICGILSK